MNEPLRESLFVRTGTDPNANDYRHSLVYCKENGQELLYVISEGREPNGKEFREEWEHSEGLDKILQLLTENLYLVLGKKEVEHDILPKLSRLSPGLAARIGMAITEDVLFSGDD